MGVEDTDALQECEDFGSFSIMTIASGGTVLGGRRSL